LRPGGHWGWAGRETCPQGWGAEPPAAWGTMSPAKTVAQAWWRRKSGRPGGVPEGSPRQAIAQPGDRGLPQERPRPEWAQDWGMVLASVRLRWPKSFAPPGRCLGGMALSPGRAALWPGATFFYPFGVIGRVSSYPSSGVSGAWVRTCRRSSGFVVSVAWPRAGRPPAGAGRRAAGRSVTPQSDVTSGAGCDAGGETRRGSGRGLSPALGWKLELPLQLRANAGALARGGRV